MIKGKDLDQTGRAWQLQDWATLQILVFSSGDKVTFGRPRSLSAASSASERFSGCNYSPG